MTASYTDFYWQSEVVEVFWPVIAHEPNIIGPVYDSIANRYVIAVRSDTPLDCPSGATLLPLAEAQSLLGVWA